ncbi:NAD-dependent deacetylase [Maribacter vaceletii]|uniref:NAD-dependent protein deacylase n=1 Tax=Maribacter vaceletii TaxID=1206816 RepID=A0A495E948_9FLAO|nr:NAD-dependent deacylase [Maribacter vaceletii]RKR13448.1 NAD-dependent deacetylase [Maribacter vaceletii]
MKKNIVVLTGAGISAESGIKTFRDADGLWEGHDIMEVATPQGFNNNPSLVLDFYNQRRKQLLTVKPNASHYALAHLQDYFNVHIITQNVDDLHERSGSKQVTHLHGELLKVRSSIDENIILPWKKDINLGDLCSKGSQLRPHIVWFGEDVPMMDEAMQITEKADVLIIVGTSMQVYPAAGLIDYAPVNTPIYFIDPKPSITENNYSNLNILTESATKGVPSIVKFLIDTML